MSWKTINNKYAPSHEDVNKHNTSDSVFNSCMAVVCETNARSCCYNFQVGKNGRKLYLEGTLTPRSVHDSQRKVGHNHDGLIIQ